MKFLVGQFPETGFTAAADSQTKSLGIEVIAEHDAEILIVVDQEQTGGLVLDCHHFNLRSVVRTSSAKANTGAMSVTATLTNPDNAPINADTPTNCRRYADDRFDKVSRSTIPLNMEN